MTYTATALQMGRNKVKCSADVKDVLVYVQNIYTSFAFVEQKPAQ